MSDNNVYLHRVLKAQPEKVYRAFTDAVAMASWIPPQGFLCTVQEFNATAGGTYRMTFHNFSTGSSHSFGGEFIALVPNESLKYTDRFDNPGLPGEMTTTVVLKKVMVGTEIRITQEGIPAAIPAEMCYLGWQESLEKLAKLVEPVIPDA